MTRRAASAAFTAAGITADDLRVLEVHDCFAANEVGIHITSLVALS
jgi:sterol carrier protein 2